MVNDKLELKAKLFRGFGDVGVVDCKAAYPIPIPTKNTPTAIPIKIL